MELADSNPAAFSYTLAHSPRARMTMFAISDLTGWGAPWFSLFSLRHLQRALWSETKWPMALFKAAHPAAMTALESDLRITGTKKPAGRERVARVQASRFHASHLSADITAQEEPLPFIA